MPARAVIFASKSTADKQIQSIPSQIHACRELCEAESYEVASSYISEGVSGAPDLSKRETLFQMLESLPFYFGSFGCRELTGLSR